MKKVLVRLNNFPEGFRKTENKDTTKTSRGTQKTKHSPMNKKHDVKFDAVKQQTHS